MKSSLYRQRVWTCACNIKQSKPTVWMADPRAQSVCCQGWQGETMWHFVLIGHLHLVLLVLACSLPLLCGRWYGVLVVDHSLGAFLLLLCAWRNVSQIIILPWKNIPINMFFQMMQFFEISSMCHHPAKSFLQGLIWGIMSQFEFHCTHVIFSS